LDSNLVDISLSVILVVLLSSSPIKLTKTMGLFDPPGQNPSSLASVLVLLFTDWSVSSLATIDNYCMMTKKKVLN